MEQVNNAVIRVQERLSDCAPKALQMKQREWEKERRVGVETLWYDLLSLRDPHPFLGT